ncbi:hypothetical protein BG011_006833 [Mortierella polycephala]|uniref:Phosphatidylglycerol/phosphatidylinositol transfer protein n=1 Tax=Mortierella polycephala TaxID=41804 RepID=A0A9P6TZ30_9FUNG|nr:hypothetical protein BG011_006833 [Mortierella polycephala]
MKFITAVAALFVATVANAQAPTFTDCATGTPDMTVTSFSVSPYPLCVGQDVCATVVGTLGTPIDGAAALSIVGKYLGRVVYTDNHGLCDVLAGTDHPCPVDTSVTSVVACVLVKPNAPVGIPVSLTIQATNGSGNTLFCQSATVTAASCP